MSGKSAAFANDLLKLIFWGTAISDIAENDATSPLTEYFCALHTADPGESGTQATSECSYTGYARLSRLRTAGHWSITGDVVSPAADMDFPARTDVGTQVATHMSIGVASSGATKILYSGALSPSITITQGVTPRVRTTSTLTEV